MNRAQAIVLAAGRGERMRPLTDHCPKPLLQVQGRPLIAWHLLALAAGGVREVVVNTAWMGEQFEPRLRALALPMDIRYSHEGRDFGAALETAGGIARALPLLDDAFWVVAGDVYVPAFQFKRDAMVRFLASGLQAHLVLVPNPPHNPGGDFAIDSAGLARSIGDGRLTYSTIGLYRQSFFAALPAGNPQGLKAPLAPLLREAMDNELVSAERYDGPWTDVGTPQRLAQLNQT